MTTDTNKIINPFKEQDIDFANLPSEDTRYGSEVLGNLKEMQIGSGQYAFYSNESGIWLGAKKFVDAPFSVDMYGNLKATVGTFSGDIDGANITGSTISGNTITGGSISGTSITGSTLSTGGSGDQHIEISSTIISYFDEYGDDVGYTYAEDGTYIVKSSGDLHFIGASSGDLSISFGSSVDYVMNNDYFYPVNDADLGTSAYRWGTVYCSGILVSSGNEINASGSDVYVGSLTLNGTTIYDWSDVASDPTQSQIEDILSDIGGMTGVTLRVRRVDSGGADSGWYYLHFTYGLLDTATVN